MRAVPAYTLYKAPVQLDTLAMGRYLHSVGVDARPARIVELGHPAWAAPLPAVELAASGEACVLEAAAAFARERPGYAIRK